MHPSETPSRTHDLFVSYAHADDLGEHRGKVTALVEAVRADYRRVAGVELNIFFDVGEIRSMDDWEVRILRGLRHSKMMVAVLSPAYFASDYCRKEWEIYVETELAHALPGEGIAPIYVIRHPAFPNGATDERLKHWIHNLSKRQYIDWIDFWPEGAEALGRADAHRRLEALPGQIADRLRRAAVRDAAPNTVPLPSTHFVGRRDELHAVRRQLVSNHVGAITALHGIPGIGKTMLAFAYAWGYGYEYPGGRYLVKAAGLADLAAGVVALAEPLGLVLSDEERNRPDVVLGKIKRKLESGPAALLVLDNVDDPALLEPQSRERALPCGDHIHVLATTRVAPERLPRIHCVPLDALEPADALALLQSFRPAADSAEDDEWKAALEVVRRLAGHALALEVVGVFLRENPATSYRTFAKSLEDDGVMLLETVVGPEAKGRLEWHAESCVAQLLKPTLTGLSLAERRAVEYAAQLPPDEIPLSWLRALLLKDMPDLQQKGLVDPVAKAFTRLERLRLVVPLTRERGTALAADERDGPRLARMHRLVQDIVTADLCAEDAAERADSVKTLAIKRADEIQAAWGRTDLGWELPTLRDLALRLLQADDWNGAMLADRIDKPLRHVGRLLDVRLLWQRTIAVEQKRCEAAPENADYARDLSVSCERLGDLHLALGEPARARDYYERALKTRERLAALAPENADYARDLTVSYIKLGDLHRALGEPARARDYYERALKIAERLAALAPENADWQRDLWVSCWKMGKVSEELNDGTAKSWWLRTHDVLQAMLNQGLFVSSGDQGFLNQLKENLGL
jgi:tetratricopeptide (TPR) repeat protein